MAGLALGVLSIGTAAEAAFRKSPRLRYLVVAGGAFGYYFAVLGLVTGFFIEHAVVMACFNLYAWPWVTIVTGVVFGLFGGYWYARSLNQTRQLQEQLGYTKGAVMNWKQQWLTGAGAMFRWFLRDRKNKVHGAILAALFTAAAIGVIIAGDWGVMLSVAVVFASIAAVLPLVWVELPN